jgi:antirestriction protein ArdC
MKTDLYQTVTDKIVAMLEAGVKPWHQPWATAGEGRITRPLRHNGQPYNGINVLLLWAESVERGYVSPFWFTYKQAGEMGAHVRKGERGTMIVFASTFEKTEEKPDGTEAEKRIPFLKSYTVFNAEQIDGLPERYSERPVAVIDTAERVAQAEAYFANIPAVLSHGGARAFYSPSQDRIQLPEFEAFESPAAYYGTRAHETIHWTRHESRLNRDFGRKSWGDEGYAAEELVAEIGAAFVCAALGLAPIEEAEQSAAYIASWLKVLRNDKRAIFTAASYASKAADYLDGYQHQADEAEAA